MTTITEPPYRRIQIAESLDAAIAAMRKLLFEPFALGIWVSFGVMVFLETQFSNLRFPALHFIEPEWEDRGVREQAEALIGFIDSHGLAVIGLLVLLLIGYVIFMVVTTWLSTRASLMLVRAVAESDHRVEPNWHATRHHHQSLFVMTVILRAIGLVANIAAIGVSAGVLWAFGVDEVISFVGAVLFLAPIGLAWALVRVALGALALLLREFVVPIMWRNDITCLAAVSEFRDIARDNAGTVLMYFLVIAAFYVVLTVTTVLTGLLTCFLGFLPVIHQTLLAPIYVAQRAVGIAIIDSVYGEHAPAEETD